MNTSKGADHLFAVSEVSQTKVCKKAGSSNKDFQQKLSFMENFKDLLIVQAILRQKIQMFSKYQMLRFSIPIISINSTFHP